ncbi:MAG: hypothetical protein OEL83_14555 [Desulforhopalus sp.]|nr:hypothetical protein [Desulforhopalus sp.]
MTSYELLAVYQQLSELLNKLEPYTIELNILYDEINELNRQSIDLLISSGINNESTPILSQKRQDIINKQAQFAQNFNMLGHHASLIEISKTINSMKNSTDYSEYIFEINIIEGVIIHYDIMTKQLYEYIKTRNHHIISSLLGSIKTAVELLQNFKENHKYLLSFSDRLENTKILDITTDSKELIIHLDNKESDFGKFIDSLNYINKIYLELSEIANIKQRPLVVKRIESGSILGKLIGSDKLIDLIVLILQRTIELIFTKFTFEGKMTRKKEVIDILMNEIKVIDECNKMNIKVDQLAQEAITKSIALIASDTLRLVSNATKIKINDKEYSISENAKAKYLEQNSKLLIEE